MSIADIKKQSADKMAKSVESLKHDLARSAPGARTRASSTT